MKRNNFFIALIVFAFVSGCRKMETAGNLSDPGVALTFDDCSIDNWYKSLPLLDSFGVHATFYISAYHRLNDQQKEKLRAIEAHGNEIAYHTTNHYNLVDYESRQGMKDVLEIEINQDLKKMNRDGFYPKSFAYPFGAHSLYLDNQLLKIFSSVRMLNGSPDLSKSLASTKSNADLFALSLDNDRHSLQIIKDMLGNAKSDRACLVLVAHQINNPSAKYSVSYGKLKAILQNVRDLGIRFYTASEIAQ